ncbi:MAG: hypothetical protein E7293_11515 [Lachnospiraceae bacterium]|nr:hypothetical protein [Lachnospiraceae bacterium]
MSYYDLPIIDCHIHVSANGDNSKRPSLQRHQEFVQEVFDKTGDEAMVLLSYWYEKGDLFGKAGGVNLMDTPLGYYLKQKCPQKLYLFGAVSRHMQTPSRNTREFYLEQTKFRHQAGCDGFKSLAGHCKNYRIMGRLSAPVLDLHYEYLEAHQLPIMIHVGNPQVLILEKSEQVEPQEYLEDITELLTKFPKLRLILPHFNFMSQDLDKAEDLLNRWENLYFDLTPNIFMYEDFNKYPDQVVRSFFERNSDKILYGTDTFLEEGNLNPPLQVQVVRDFFEKEHSDFLASMGLHTVPLSKNVLKKIYRDNLMKLLPDTPSPLNPEYVIKECEGLLAYPSYLNENDGILLQEIIAYFKNVEV